MRRVLIPLTGVALCAFVLAQSGDAWARAGGGGSRGSRSYSSPARPSPVNPGLPSSPSRGFNQPAAAPAVPQRSGLFGGLMGGLAGFALGGLLGGLLFGGLGHGLGGIGLYDIPLIGGGIALLVMFMRRRRAETPQPAYAMAGGQSGSYAGYEPAGAGRGRAGGATMEMPVAAEPPAVSDLERGIGHIRQMDPRFDPESFVTVARNAFLEVQQAVAQRDVTWLRDRIAPEFYASLQAQCDRLRASHQTNHVEQIRIQRAEITEAWQEGGRDFATVYLTVSLLDYTVDDATGGVVDGSKSAVQNVEEFWTFARPVGSNPWQLTAIQSA